MIDTKELRAVIQKIGLNGVCPAEIIELLDRLEESESDALEQARLNGMGSEREAALMAKLEAAEKERDALRAKISDLTINVEYLGNLKKSYEELIGELQDERDALRTELADLRSSMTFRTSLIGRIEAECASLRARVEAMERQEPVGTVHAMPGADAFTMACFDAQDIPVGAMLYALPGAKGE